MTQYSPLTFTCETQSTNTGYVIWGKRVGNADVAIGTIVIRGDNDCSPPYVGLAPNSTLYSYACPATNRLTLTIRNVSRTENGVKWRCQVLVNGTKENSNEETITVQVGITDVTLSPATDPFNVTENTPTTLECQTSGGLPAASVRWFIQRSGQVQDVTSLSTNTYKEMDDLNVTQSSLNFTPVIIGTTFTISCTVDSNPSPYSYQWSPSGGSSQQLGFTDIQRIKNGEYTLQVLNRMPVTGSSSPVNGIPPAVPTIRMSGKDVTGTVKVIDGKSKAFNCSTESNPVSNYSWTYPKGFSFNNILQVNNFQSSSHNGDYTCHVRNRMEPSFDPPRLPLFKYETITGSVINDNTIAIVLGDEASVACEAHANPAPHTYTWSGSQTNGQLLSLSSFNVNTTVECTAYNTMTETNESPTDMSNYSTLQINVWRPPQSVTLQYHYGLNGSMSIKKELKVLASEAFWLSCTADSSPSSTYTWSGHPSSRAGIFNVTGGLTTSQSVSCLAENYMQTTYKGTVRGNTSAALHIDVLYGPKTGNLQNVSKVRGESFVYKCLYTPGNPPAVDFEWTRSETGISWAKQITQNLTIPNVQRLDEASYTCKVSNGAENLMLQLNNVSHNSEEVDEHSSNEMECFLESDPGSDMALTKDGKTIIAISGVHKLTHVLQAECSDTGVYTCSGYNQYGAADNAFREAIAWGGGTA
ncbi:HMCN1-like protein [Mya arenaria]|uniref:HMCN1-like protein n=1 Tax=Mya arenaria TaxID=6604 RepID=A0ABY7EB66_MYAAR|nr:HMCN1-like protein [Mya arenaria]